MKTEFQLIVTDWGDRSVGIWSQTWAVDVPIYIEDKKQINKADKEDLEFFRSKILEVYKEFSNGRVTAEYDFEIERENEFYKSQDYENS